MKAISLFSGAGGFDVGMERAGFDTVLATDHDAGCVATLEANCHARVPVDGRTGRFHLDKAEIVRADIANLDFTRFAGHVDVVFGGPPCQAFSSSGHMGSLDDPRGRLVHQFTRAVAEIRPRAFVMENVRGLVTARDGTGEPGGVLHGLLEELGALGYGCGAFLLNAADFGAYQRRVRCFLVGLRGALAAPPPEATHRPMKAAESAELFDAPPWRTLGEFLRLHGDRDAAAWQRPSDRLLERLGDVADGSGLKSPGVVETTRPGGHWGYRQGTFVADRCLPARTVTGSATQDLVRMDDGSLRRLSLREVALLQGFPEGWTFAGTTSRRHLQVGNAVPAALAQAVGRHVRELLFRKDGRQAAASARTPAVTADIARAIRYTQREEARNGDSRAAKVRATLKPPAC